MSPFERNIRVLFFTRAMLYSWVTIPTLALFYLDQGLSLADLIVFKTVLSAIALALEIPSGYMADVWGRKKTGIVGCSFWVLSILLYIVGEGYYYFLFAEILLGVAASLLSGVDSALAYDSLLAADRSEKYKRVESTMSSISGFSEACGGLLGAFLASFNLVYPFYLQFALVVGALVFMFRLVEPPRNQRGFSEVSAWKGILRTVGLVLKKDRGLQSLTIFYGVSASCTLLLVWLAQGYMEAIELSTIWYGVVWAVLHFAMAGCSQVAHRVDSVLGSAKTLFGMLVLTGISFLALGFVQSFPGLIFILLLYCVRGVRTPLFRYYVNRIVPSEVRATVLSVQGFSVRVVTLVIGPLLAFTVESYSLATALYAMSLFSLVFLTFGFLRIRQTGVLSEGYVSKF